MVGRDCENLYSSKSHYDKGGDGPLWLVREREPFLDSEFCFRRE
jgi:hypothetical protein